GMRSKVILPLIVTLAGGGLLPPPPPPPPPQADSNRHASAPAVAGRNNPRYRAIMGGLKGAASRSIPGAPNLPQHALRRKSTRRQLFARLKLQRSFGNRRLLLAQRQDLVLPVARLDEPRKRRRECGVAPAPREPRRIMNHAQRAQALDQHQLARIEGREVGVALQQM